MLPPAAPTGEPSRIPLMECPACSSPRSSASVSRLPLDFLDSIVRVHAANDAFLLLLVVIDTVRHRRLHPAFLWGTAFVLSMQAFSTWLSATAFWERAARAIL
jgi:hypothetical protein